MEITYLVGNGFNLNSGLDTRYNDFVIYCQNNASTPKFSRVSHLIGSNDLIYPGWNKQWNEIKLWSEFEQALGLCMYHYPSSTFSSYVEMLNDISSCLKQFLSRSPPQRTKSPRLSSRRAFFKQLVSVFPICDELLRNLKGVSLQAARKASNGQSPIRRWLGNIQVRFKIWRLPRLKKWTFRFVSFTHNDALLHYIEHYRWRLWANGRRISMRLPIIQHSPMLGVSKLEDIAHYEIDRISKIQSATAPTHVVHLIDALLKEKIDGNSGNNCFRLIEEQIRKSNIVCIYGMSLGISDRIWWNTIIEWLNADIRHYLVIFWHDDRMDSSQVKDAFLGFETSWLSSKPEYWHTAGYHVIENQIFVQEI